MENQPPGKRFFDRRGHPKGRRMSPLYMPLCTDTDSTISTLFFASKFAIQPREPVSAFNAPLSHS